MNKLWAQASHQSDCST